MVNYIQWAGLATLCTLGCCIGLFTYLTWVTLWGEVETPQEASDNSLFYGFAIPLMLPWGFVFV